MHFGVDFAAKCGTEVVAIGDGVVAKIDAREHGAGPHNLMINHPETGYASFYGHLLQTPQLYLGQSIQRGQVIGYTGDPDLTCTSRPHLHLEIRNIGYWIAYNPVPLIDADWDSLALLGVSGFERDLQQPRRWVTPYDQPEIHFGQEMLNDYENPWPPDWNY
jgi:murein DD-endopeptidase MepM/ murein hydrolase activator NlpD